MAHLLGLRKGNWNMGPGCCLVFGLHVIEIRGDVATFGTPCLNLFLSSPSKRTKDPATSGMAHSILSPSLVKSNADFPIRFNPMTCGPYSGRSTCHGVTVLPSTTDCLILGIFVTRMSNIPMFVSPPGRHLRTSETKSWVSEVAVV